MILPRKGTELGLFRALARSASVANLAAGAASAPFPCHDANRPSIFADQPERSPEPAKPVRKTISVIALLMIFASGDARAQTAVGVNAGAGYSFVDPLNWLGVNVFNPSQISYLGTAHVIFGQRYGTGIQVGLEGGLHRIMTYDVDIGGNTIRGDATAFRALGFVRFWFGESEWFGEVGVGAFMFDGFNNPSINPALGTILGDGPVQFPVKLRGSLLFDRQGMVFPLVVEAGFQYEIGS